MSNLKTNLPVVVGVSERYTSDLVERPQLKNPINPAELPPPAKLLAFMLALVVMGIMRSRGVPVRLAPPLILLAQRFGLPRHYGLLLKFLSRS
jgi:hypothetical protein